MDEPGDAPVTTLAQATESTGAKLAARIIGPTLTALLAMMGTVFTLVVNSWFSTLTTTLANHGAAIAAIQASVTAGQTTNSSTHSELKAFRAETTAAREQTAQRLELIEKQIREIEPRVKEIEQKVKGQ